jgi:excisionase family DNA binding protein
MTFDVSAGSGKYFTQAEIAERLRCSRPHVSNLIRRGELGAFRLGERIIVSESQLNEMLARAEQPAKAA